MADGLESPPYSPFSSCDGSETHDDKSAPVSTVPSSIATLNKTTVRILPQADFDEILRHLPDEASEETRIALVKEKMDLKRQEYRRGAELASESMVNSKVICFPELAERLWWIREELNRTAWYGYLLETGGREWCKALPRCYAARWRKARQTKRKGPGEMKVKAGVGRRSSGAPPRRTSPRTSARESNKTKW